MQVGAVPEDLRSLVAELAPGWRGRPVYVGCSANFSLERILTSVGLTNLHSNDVSLYSCAVGSHLAGVPCPVTLTDEAAWMAPYVEPGGEALIAHLLLAMEYVKVANKPAHFHRRMARAYEQSWPSMHARTLARVHAALDGVALASFTPGDVVDFVARAPEDAVVIAWPPNQASRPETTWEAWFRWDAPPSVPFDESRLEALLPALQAKARWLTIRAAPVPALDPHRIGSFQPSTRATTVSVYAGAGRSRVSTPLQRTEAVPMGRLEGVGTGPLRILRLTGPQIAMLRSEYLAPGINPATAQYNYGVAWGDKLVGACSFNVPIMLGRWCSIYQMADFAVRPSVYPRLSKLVLAAVLSTEMRVALEQGVNSRVTTIGTTAFTKKAMSMKYRGLFEVHSRKEGAVHYIADAGRWSLAEGLRWWLETNGQVRPQAGEHDGVHSGVHPLRVGSIPATRSS